GFVVDRDQRIPPRARRLLVGLAGADEDELARVVDGRRRPDRYACTGGRVVLRRIHAPPFLARVGVQAYDVSPERVVGLPDPLLERRDADDDGVTGQGRGRVDAEERLRVERSRPDDLTGVAAERVELPVADRRVHAL